MRFLAVNCWLSELSVTRRMLPIPVVLPINAPVEPVEPEPLSEPEDRVELLPLPVVDEPDPRDEPEEPLLPDEPEPLEVEDGEVVVDEPGLVLEELELCAASVSGSAAAIAVMRRLRI